jgi:hypothetical protein
MKRDSIRFRVHLMVILVGSVLGPVCWWGSGLVYSEWCRLLYRAGITKRDVPVTELRDLRWEEGRLHFTYTVDMWDGNPDCTTITKTMSARLSCRYWAADGSWLGVEQVWVTLERETKEGHRITSTHGWSSVDPLEGAMYMAIDDIRHPPRKVRIPNRPPPENDEGKP